MNGNWGRKLLVGVPVIAIAALVVFVWVHLAGQNEERAEWKRITDSAIASASQSAEAYDFARAIKTLEGAETKVGGLDLRSRLGNALDRMSFDKTEFEDKLQSGYVVFEGKLIRENKKHDILGRRREAQIQRQQREAAQARQRQQRLEQDARQEAITRENDERRQEETRRQQRNASELAAAQSKRKQRIALFKNNPASSFRFFCARYMSALEESAPQRFFNPHKNRWQANTIRPLDRYSVDLQRTNSLMSPYIGTLQFEYDTAVNGETSGPPTKQRMFFAAQDNRWHFTRSEHEYMTGDRWGADPQWAIDIWAQAYVATENP